MMQYKMTSTKFGKGDRDQCGDKYNIHQYSKEKYLDADNKNPTTLISQPRAKRLPCATQMLSLYMYI